MGEAKALEKKVDRLEEVLIELAVAQRRTEESLDRLSEAQRRTEEEQRRFWQGLEELKKAQRRTEESLDKLSEEQRKFWQGLEELKEAQRRTEEAQRRTEESLNGLSEELKKALKNLTRKMEGLSERLGTLAEDILAPGIPYLLERLGYRVKSMWVNEEVRLADGRNGEFDVVVVAERNGREVLFLCEVKSKLERGHFEQLRKQCELYREVGMRRDLSIIPALAALSIPEHLMNYATRRGVLLVKMGGDYLEALNPEVVEA